MANDGSSSTSKRGKKGSSSNKPPKQPQRGLGVAQLEKIRILNQMEEMKIQAYNAAIMGGAPPSHFVFHPSQSLNPYGYPYPPHVMMGIGDMERVGLRFGESHPCIHQSRWNPSLLVPDNQSYAAPSLTTRHFLDTMEDSKQDVRKNLWMNMNGSMSQNLGASDHGQDLDLELRL